MNSIRNQIGFMFLAFFALVGISVGATFWGVNEQEQDAVVINLAGRQRMLVQQMTRLALEIEKGETDHFQELHEAAQTFARTLQAFQFGGEAPYLPGRVIDVRATRDEDILVQLSRVEQTWGAFQAAQAAVSTSPPGSEPFREAMGTIESLSPALVAEADLVVRLYENASSGKLQRLRWIQTAFLLSALLLLGSGVWGVSRGVLAPLQALGQAADRIGAGDLASPIQTTGAREIAVLADTLESMRQQLQRSHEELLAWGGKLEERVAYRTRELEALNKVGQEISSRLDLDHVLSTITEKAQELVGGDIAILCMSDPEGALLRVHSFSGPKQAVQKQVCGARNPGTRQLLSSPKALLCENDLCGPACQIMADAYRASHLVVPLRAGNQVIGALCAGSRKEHEFSGEAVDLLTRLANSAAIALENARLYADAERLAALEERQRIAADMHDGLAQTLSSIGLLAERVISKLEEGKTEAAREALQRLHLAASQSTREVRQAIASLQSDPPRPRSLQEEITSLVERYRAGSQPGLQLACDLAEPLHLEKQAMQHVLRLAEEGLRNAIHHAQAGQITLQLDRHPAGFRLTIQDDGVGFCPEEVPPNHFGLQIMQARAVQLGGELTVASTPSAGTILTLVWPAAGQPLAEAVR